MNLLVAADRPGTLLRVAVAPIGREGGFTLLRAQRAAAELLAELFESCETAALRAAAESALFGEEVSILFRAGVVYAFSFPSLKQKTREGWTRSNVRSQIPDLRSEI